MLLLTNKAINRLTNGFVIVVGMTRFELATPRPPDAYSNRPELHPETIANV